MFQDIALKDLLQEQHETEHTIIDVRSQKEFQEATIPGSINIPVFNNDERAEVGTIYKQVGQEAAKERGLEIFSEKLPAFIAAFKEINGSKTVFCWRGGMRSKTAATVLDLMGIQVNRLIGGIRSYRNWVVEHLGSETFSPELYVLNGFTGTGKTIILQRLAAMGYPVINLEEMAGHRGSVFGQIGKEPSKQKKFDSSLVTEMMKYQQEPFVLIEGESKRIGKVSIPDFFYDKKEEGVQIFIDLPMEKRVEIILEEYKPWERPDQFKKAYQYIKKRIHVPIAKQIEDFLETGQYQEAVELMLEYYYDPRYEYSNGMPPENKSVLIKATDVDTALQHLLKCIHERNTTTQAQTQFL